MARIWEQDGYESHALANSVMADPIPDLEDKNGELSYAKLVAHLVHLQKDIGALITRTEKMDLLVAKIRSAEAVTTQLTREIDNLRVTLTNDMKKMVDFQLALQNLNEKYNSHIVVSEQSFKVVSELTEQLTKTQGMYHEFDRRLLVFENSMQEHSRNHGNLDGTINAIQEDFHTLQEQANTNSEMLSRIATTYKTIIMIITAIGSLIGLLVTLWQNIMPSGS